MWWVPDGAAELGPGGSLLPSNRRQEIARVEIALRTALYISRAGPTGVPSPSTVSGARHLFLRPVFPRRL
jgi:hypothetical protein